MNIRMTLTAIALGAMALTGCSTLKGADTATAPAEPAAVAAPEVAAPAIAVDAPAAPAIAVDAPATTSYAPAEAAVTVEETVTVTEEVMVKEGEATEEVMVKEEVTVKEEASVTANDAAINACFAAGGQVVGWVGDPTGAEQACRREDGLEYRLADAQYYQ